MAAADGSQAADRARADLERIRDALTAEVRRIMSALNTEKGSAVLERDRESLAFATRARRDVVAALERTGPAIEKVADRAVVRAAEDVSATVDLGDFEPDMERELDRILKGSLDEVTASLEKGADRIASTMKLAITTQARLDEAIDAVAQDIGTTFLKAQAAVDAAAMASGRLVTLRGASGAGSEEDPIVFLYVGPSDRKARDFCRERVGKAFTEEALERGDNGDGQPRPASLYLGGYNCRHSLAPMLKSEALAEGIEVVE